MTNYPFEINLIDKTNEQLLEDINSLSSKLNFAYKSNKPVMVRQLIMVLDLYKNEYSKRQEILLNKKYNGDKKISIE